MKKFINLTIIITFLGLLTPIKGAAIQGKSINFDRNWQFSLNNTSSWRTVNLPHDWSIEGSFSKQNPCGTGGGALPGGIGWYKKTFTYQSDWKGNKVYIDFDGIYQDSEVWINGYSLGIRPYGFISFRYELTPWLKDGTNTITVRVDNSKQPNCRWYSGSGIYRNVHLVILNRLHFAHWGINIKPTIIGNKNGKVKITAEIQNEQPATVQASVSVKILNSNHRVVTSAFSSPIKIESNQNKEEILDLSVNNPRLWSPDSPYLYSVVTQLIQNKRIVESDTTYTGFRSIRFDAAKGFFLNDQPLKIKGVCLHHDAGCLGSVVNRRAIERELSIMKKMGCNAIRCSHNPPAPELLDLCDKMGLMVMDESFDMWRKKKTTYDYSQYFDKWYEHDITDWLLRDRNHTSVILWCIGNEVLEQWNDVNTDTMSIEEANLLLNLKKSPTALSAKSDSLNFNSKLALHIANIVKQYDDRPITAACNEPSPTNNLFRSGALDVIGFNYHNDFFKSVPKNFPGKPFIITESTSALQTRGYYRMPSDSVFIWPKRWDIPFDDPSHACSSYDNCYVPWGTTHEQSLIDLRDNDFISGMFVWTGFDYIGEPTPYQWPSRSSYFGIVDLAGFPKDSYYLYQSMWTNKPALHIFPHWNWKEGEAVDVWAYYSKADEVELYLNGISQGIRRKSNGKEHVVWHLKYQPGTLIAVSRKNSQIVKTDTVRTAGEPAQIRLIADRSTIKADGSDLSYITVEVLDKNGILCPLATNEIRFELNNDNCIIAGVDNGDPTSMESFKADHRKAFYGKCLIVLQNNYKKGKVILKASGKGLQSTNLTITCI